MNGLLRQERRPSLGQRQETRARTVHGAKPFADRSRTVRGPFAEDSQTGRERTAVFLFLCYVLFSNMRRLGMLGSPTMPGGVVQGSATTPGGVVQGSATCRPDVCLNFQRCREGPCLTWQRTWQRWLALATQLGMLGHRLIRGIPLCAPRLLDVRVLD